MADSGMGSLKRRRLALRVLSVLALGVVSFFGGWCLRANLLPTVRVVRPAGAFTKPTGTQIVQIAVLDPTKFSAGDEIGLVFGSPDDPEITHHVSSFVVHSVERSSISLFVDEARKDSLIEYLAMPDCRIVRRYAD